MVRWSPALGHNGTSEFVPGKAVTRAHVDTPLLRFLVASGLLCRPEMTNTSGLACLFVFVAVLSVACANSPTTPTSPSSSNGSSSLTADQVSGTWTLTSIQSANQPSQPVPTGATYSLTLANGRLSTRADCNTCTGAFTLTGLTLSTSTVLACTRAACTTAAFEQAYTSILAGDSAVSLADGALVLDSPRGTLRFTR